MRVCRLLDPGEHFRFNSTTGSTVLLLVTVNGHVDCAVYCQDLDKLPMIKH